ncbi:MAG: BspA family leucine-rich repeat surface protein [Cellulosilyticaceae bacterium]
MKNLKNKFKKRLSLFLVLCVCVMTIQVMHIQAFDANGGKDGVLPESVTQTTGAAIDIPALSAKTSTILTINLENVEGGYSKYKPTLYIQNKTGQSLDIDWGDGSKDLYEADRLSLEKSEVYNVDKIGKTEITITITPTTNANGVYILGSGGADNPNDNYNDNAIPIIVFEGERDSYHALTNVIAGPNSSVGKGSFRGCINLVEADITQCDTSSITDMSNMFLECRSLIKLELGKFDTANVTNMARMFEECMSLTKLDVSSFDTKNVTNMADMFCACMSLTELDVSGFDTSNVTSMRAMFASCRKVKELDVSGFDTSKVTNMSNMFLECKFIEKLDMGNFDNTIIGENDMYSMYCTFAGCYSLQQVRLGEKFKFRGVLSHLPEPSDQDNYGVPGIPGATGRWYAISEGVNGKGYAPEDVHKNENSIKTYVAVISDDIAITISKDLEDAVGIIGKVPPSLRVSAKATYNREISYQWYKNTISSTVGGTPIQGATYSKYDLPNNLAKGDYYYYCELIVEEEAEPTLTKVAKVTIKEDDKNEEDDDKYDDNNDEYEYKDDDNEEEETDDYIIIDIPEFEGGNVVVVNGKKIKKNDTVTIIITPYENYEIADVIIDGVSVGVVTKYTFEKLTYAPTIDVIFRKIDDLLGQNNNLLDTQNHNAYMEGYKDNEFKAENNMTRAEVVVMFSRLMKSPMDSSKIYASSFIDVDSDKWYANEVGYMESLSIINGYRDGTFRGDMPITRAEFATIASRLMPVEEGELIFTDEDNIFDPNQMITRAEAVTIVNHMLERKCTVDIILDNEEVSSNIYTDVTPKHEAYGVIYEASNTHENEK